MSALRVYVQAREFHDGFDPHLSAISRITSASPRLGSTFKPANYVGEPSLRVYVQAREFHAADEFFLLRPFAFWCLNFDLILQGACFRFGGLSFGFVRPYVEEEFFIFLFYVEGIFRNPAFSSFCVFLLMFFPMVCAKRSLKTVSHLIASQFCSVSLKYLLMVSVFSLIACSHFC